MIKISYEHLAELGNQVNELSDKNSDINEDLDTIDEAYNATGVLSELSNVIENTDNTPSDTVIQISDLAIETICDNLGMLNKGREVYSLENFKTSKVFNRNIAVEDIKEKINKIWKAIVDFFKIIFEKVKSFFSKVSSTSKTLENLLDNLRKVANERSSWVKKKSSITVSDSIILTFKNKDYETMIKNHYNISMMLSIVIDNANDTIRQLENIVKGKDFNSDYDVLANNAKSIIINQLNILNETSDDNYRIVEYGPFYGNTSIVCKEYKNNSVIDFTVKKSPDNVETNQIDATDGNELFSSIIRFSGTCEKVLEKTKSLESKLKEINKIEEELKHLFRSAEKIDIAEMGSMDYTRGLNQFLSKVQRYSIGTTRACYFLFNYIPGININLCKSGIRFYHLQLDNLKRNS